MSATIKCTKCGRITHARVIEDDHTINSLVLQDDIDWKDEDVDDDKIGVPPCPHEEYEILEIEYDDNFD